MEKRQEREVGPSKTSGPYNHHANAGNRADMCDVLDGFDYRIHT